MTVVSSHLFQIEEEATEDSLMRTIMGRSIHARFVVQVKSITYFRYRFNDALWGHSPNNSDDSKVGSFQQGVEHIDPP